CTSHRESAMPVRGHVEARGVCHLVAAPERPARALDAVGGDDFIAAPPRDLTELLVHPAIRVTNPKVAVYELESLSKAVHETLVEFLESRRLASGAVQDHDRDRESGEKVEEHERHAHGEVPTRPERGVEEDTDDPVHAPQGERHGEEAGPTIGHRCGPSRPEL